jgi:hypothetical protein
MKQVLLLFLLPLLARCNSEPEFAPQAQQLIRSQIAAHYDSLQLQGYYPLSSSGIDTIAVTRNQQGDITAIIGEVTHRYRTLQGDVLKEQTEVFNVQVHEDGVETMPAKPMSVERDLQLIII